MAGIYIHIPFCLSKCGYCDFYSTTDISSKAGFLKAVEREIEARAGYLANEPVKTVYIGGGTPSLYSPVEIQELINTVKKILDIKDPDEITMEANPDDLSERYFDGLADTDVNRLSIGIQSFDDRLLSFMGRRHDAGAAERAVRAAQKAGFDNISIDLIYGVPELTAQRWRRDIEKALALDVRHISAYHLGIEEGTPFSKRHAAGEFRMPDSAESERQYLLLHEMLTAGGFRHYEISNFALDGFQAIHNSSYWSGESYLGLGPSAHSFNGCSRGWNTASISEYLRSAGTDAIYREELLSGRDKYNEFIMLSLRRASGIDPDALKTRFGNAAHEKFMSQASLMLRNGLLSAGEDGRIAIPPEKFLISDTMISSLFETE